MDGCLCKAWHWIDMLTMYILELNRNEEPIKRGIQSTNLPSKAWLWVDSLTILSLSNNQHKDVLIKDLKFSTIKEKKRFCMIFSVERSSVKQREVLLGEVQDKVCFQWSLLLDISIFWSSYCCQTIVSRYVILSSCLWEKTKVNDQIFWVKDWLQSLLCQMVSKAVYFLCFWLSLTYNSFCEIFLALLWSIKI